MTMSQTTRMRLEVAGLRLGGRSGRLTRTEAVPTLPVPACSARVCCSAILFSMQRNELLQSLMPEEQGFSWKQDGDAVSQSKPSDNHTLPNSSIPIGM